MMNLGTTLTGLEVCPQCGISSPNLMYRTYVIIPSISSPNGLAWIIYQCGSCEDIVCAKGLFDHNRLTQHAIAALAAGQHPSSVMIPNPRVVDADLPDRPRRYLEQAFSSLHAPDGAIMLAGSAIDAMLKLKGYADGSVYNRIEKAVSDHVLTEGMRDWAHAVRLESNKPRHADLDEPHASKSMAEQTIIFAEALGEYLFALPARIERGKQASTAASEVPA